MDDFEKWILLEALAFFLDPLVFFPIVVSPLLVLGLVSLVAKGCRAVKRWWCKRR